jgi:hypothetical protein
LWGRRYLVSLAEINDLKSVHLYGRKRPLRSGFNHGELAAIGRGGTPIEEPLCHSRKDAARPEIEPSIG